MVIEDLSSSQSNDFTNGQNQSAPIQDRFLSFILDFLILSPLIMFINYPMFKKMKLGLMLGEADEVIRAYFLIALIVTIIAIVFYQVASIYFYGATLGQRVFQIYLDSNDSLKNSKIQLWQAIQYSVGFILSFVLLGIPFLSVFTHRKGQTFYQRLSEIQVLSLKVSQINPISEFEVRFIKQWANIASIFVFFILTSYVLQISLQKMKLSQNAKFKVNEVCENSDWNQLDHEHRLKNYFSKYLAEQQINSCIEHLVEEHVWGGIVSQDSSFIYIVKYFISKNTETQQLYLNELCRERDSDACQLIQAYEKDQLHVSFLNSEHTWVKILMIDELIRKSKFQQAFALLKNYEDSIDFEKYYSHQLAKIYFGFSQKQASRSPASQELDPIVERYKEYFGAQ